MSGTAEDLFDQLAQTMGRQQRALRDQFESITRQVDELRRTVASMAKADDTGMRSAASAVCTSVDSVESALADIAQSLQESKIDAALVHLTQAVKALKITATVNVTPTPIDVRPQITAELVMPSDEPPPRPSAYMVEIRDARGAVKGSMKIVPQFKE